MKKNLTILLMVILLSSCGSINLNAQINFENTYTVPNTGPGMIFLTNIGNNNYKYVIVDYDTEKFNLYNLDHTPFMLNIMFPISTDSGSVYKVGYITSTLFDCDSSNIEYALMTQSPNNSKKFSIYRTDGTLLFSKDSVTIPYCYGCNVGSVETHGIVNTSVGAKLVLFNLNKQVFIYGLCDKLPENIIEIIQENNYINIYPNPAYHYINFQVTLPSNFEEYVLTIFNSSFQAIKTIMNINSSKTQIKIETEEYCSGTYYYSLQNNKKIFDSGKFIITK